MDVGTMVPGIKKINVMEEVFSCGQMELTSEETGEMIAPMVKVG